MFWPISDCLVHADQSELGAHTFSAELLHVARRAVNAAAVTFSFSVMFLAPFIVSGAHSEVSDILYIMKHSAQLSLVGAIGGAGYGLGELSQRIYKTA